MIERFVGDGRGLVYRHPSWLTRDQASEVVRDTDSKTGVYQGLGKEK